jgi:hypothetical protein
MSEGGSYPHFACHRAALRAEPLARNDELKKIEHNQRNCPTGKSLPILRNRVKPQNKKYFAFPEERTVAYLSPSRPDKRGVS